METIVSNLAFSEKKTALAERDIAILQRDSPIDDRNNAIMERNNAILQYHETAIYSNPPAPRPAKSRAMLNTCTPNQSSHHQAHIVVDVQTFDDASPISPHEHTKLTRRSKRIANKKDPNPSNKLKQEDEPLSWKDGPEKDGMNRVVFDKTTMLVPMCTCAGVMRQCYKWGTRLQSSCCTNNMSVYPLPAVPNKRHVRVGGRKMSGSAFNKRINRIAVQGHDLSRPVNLKDNWAKHGTNRYSTIK